MLEDAAGRAELQRIGARSVPVLSRGDEFVFAQNIAQVVAFLKLDENTGPVLSPAQLVERLERFIDAALRIIPLMPDDKLATLTPNRPRSYARLAHHMFRIPEAFTEVAGGTYFSHGLAGEVARPEEMASTAALAAYGRGVRDNVAGWWTTTPDKSATQTVATYYGPQKLHEVLERATWHIGQHTRQWMMLLDMAGIAADRPLGDQDFAGLPMPKKVWDDNQGNAPLLPMTSSELAHPYVSPLPVDPMPESVAALRASAEPVWIFAYGSLMWNPEIAFAEACPALLRGYHRSFCLYSRDYRGTPERPGLVLGLDRGGACRGIAYRLMPQTLGEAIDHIWAREMAGQVYEMRRVPILTPQGRIIAHAFAVRRDAPDYAGRLSLEEAARVIANAVGGRGSGRDYLANTVRHLEELGISDGPLHKLAERVKALAQQG